MRSLLLVYSTGMKSLLSPWLQNIYFSPFLWILVPFLRIPVPFQWILVDSGGMAPFLQESVGQGKVLSWAPSSSPCMLLLPSCVLWSCCHGAASSSSSCMSSLPHCLCCLIVVPCPPHCNVMLCPCYVIV